MVGSTNIRCHSAWDNFEKLRLGDVTVSITLDNSALLQRSLHLFYLLGPTFFTNQRAPWWWTAAPLLYRGLHIVYNLYFAAFYYERRRTCAIIALLQQYLTLEILTDSCKNNHHGVSPRIRPPRYKLRPMILSVRQIRSKIFDGGKKRNGRRIQQQSLSFRTNRDNEGGEWSNTPAGAHSWRCAGQLESLCTTGT